MGAALLVVVLFAVVVVVVLVGVSSSCRKYIMRSNVLVGNVCVFVGIRFAAVGA